MSTGKRLAKRSIIGTRVVAPGDDGKLYPGMIQAVKTPASFPENNNCINLTPNTRYTVRFDSKAAVGKKQSREYRDSELIGPGFQTTAGVQLQPGQGVFLTHNGREVRAEVKMHSLESDELLVQLQGVGNEAVTISSRSRKVAGGDAALSARVRRAAKVGRRCARCRRHVTACRPARRVAACAVGRPSTRDVLERPSLV